MLIYFTYVNDFQVLEKFTYTSVIIFPKHANNVSKRNLYWNL